MLIAISFHLYYATFCCFVIIKYNFSMYLFNVIRYSSGVILHFRHLRCFGTVFQKPYRYFSIALRAAVRKYRLGVCKMKKSKIPKLCQNIGLGKLFLEK